MFDVREVNVAVEVWGVALCLLGIVCTLIFPASTERHRHSHLAMFAMELLAAGGDAIAGIYRGAPGPLAWAATHVGNFSTYMGNIFLLSVYTSYLRLRLDEQGESKRLARWERLVWAGVLVLVALTICGAFYRIDEHNLYSRTKWYPLTYSLALVFGLVNIVLIARKRTSLDTLAYFCLMSYSLTTIVAMGLQAFVYGLNFMIIGGILCTSLLFLEMQASTARQLVERNEELARSRVELSESRIAVMVSQIQPHFLFNTLDTIYYLCSEDPARAQMAIDRFSSFLRANLNSLRETDPVPIETELVHVRNYLELEKLSMEELLVWEIDAQAGGFMVPALALQTVAENAVKHGVGKRPGGGHVWVRTAEEQDCWLASVTDDGVGFDTSVPTTGEHVGLENTRKRLAALCGGSLEVKSELGSGTTVVLRIPKEVTR